MIYNKVVPVANIFYDIQGCPEKNVRSEIINISKTIKLMKLKFKSDYLFVLFNVSKNFQDYPMSSLFLI